LTVVVLTNLDSGHARPGKIGHEVAGLYNPARSPWLAHRPEGSL
jgi:hypothetical protein